MFQYMRSARHKEHDFAQKWVFWLELAQDGKGLEITGVSTLIEDIQQGQKCHKKLIGPLHALYNIQK